MNLPRNVAAQTKNLLAGLVVTLASVSPAMAFTFDARYLPPQNVLLIAAVVLLAIGVTLRLMRRRELSGPAPEGPDLRWWKNPMDSIA